MKENATHALGFLLVGDEKFPHPKKLIDGLCEASKVMTTYFSVMSFQPLETKEIQRKTICVLIEVEFDRPGERSPE